MELLIFVVNLKQIMLIKIFLNFAMVFKNFPREIAVVLIMATLHLAQNQLDQNTTRPNYNLAKIFLSSSRVDWYKREVFCQVVVWASCVLAEL
jgi:hypothetical protein